MRCCCGKKDIEEPLIVNDYMHEPLDMENSFCGPAYKHELRDLYAEVDRLKTKLSIKEKKETDNGEPVTGCFHTAISQLLADLVDGRLSNYEILSRWDSARGTDWVTETKKTNR